MTQESGKERSILSDLVTSLLGMSKESIQSEMKRSSLPCCVQWWGRDGEDRKEDPVIENG